MEGSEARFESGIEAKCIKYRKVKVGENNHMAGTDAASAAPASVQKDQPSPPAVNHPPATKISVSASAVPPDEGTVPSSITCDAVSKSSSREVGAGIGNKRKLGPDNASTLTANSDSPRKRPINSSNNDMLEIKIPFWLQRDQSTQKSLFLYLVGSNHPAYRGNRTVKHIGRETDCNIRVNFVQNGPTHQGFRTPITIAINARTSNPAMCARDIHFARVKIQDFLLDRVQRDGSRGRLLYDLASSCGGPHRPMASRSKCVRAKDPFAEDDRQVFMTVVHLPFEDVGGKKNFHVDFLLTSSFLTHLWHETGCYVKAAYNGSGIPVKLCFPYLLVMGKNWRNVDRAVDTLNEVIKKHINRCSCVFNTWG